MARKRASEPEPIEIRTFSVEELERGVKKLRRRLDEVKALEQGKVHHDDPRVDVVESAISESIRDVFGNRSPEVQEVGYHRIWHGPMWMDMRDHDLQEGFEAGIAVTVAMLEGLISRLEEKREDFQGNQLARTRTAFRGLPLHPRIAAVSTDAYEDGHYDDAVFRAAKALVNLVQERSGRFELDGAQLMFTVFSKNAPVLAFSDLASKTDSDEQEGMMHLFVGAVLGIRNPRGHSFYDDSPERALEFIAFLSMLANRVEETRKIK